MSSGAHAPRRHFNSRPSARGDRGRTPEPAPLGHFNSRPSARGDKSAPRQGKRHAPYFNSRPSARGDAARRRGSHKPRHFNSRPSARGDNMGARTVRLNIISIHAPPRGATALVAAKGPTASISIHAPPRGATRRCLPDGCESAYFNSRPSARGDIISVALRSSTSLFQFTPLREGRRLAGSAGRWRLCYFNSRPSARGDAACTLPTAQHPISIHAPPRGATGWRLCWRLLALAISIHAPPRGATRRVCLPEWLPHFNSRPSARGDPRLGKASGMHLISIHAPPRGATDEQRRTRAATTFQFTPLREGRPAGRTTRCRRCYFNSRPSARGDTNDFVTLLCVFISIHAPPRGATDSHGGIGRGAVFQFTPLREGRRQKKWYLKLTDDFNSRPSARGDFCNDLLVACYTISIHAPPRGATALPRREGAPQVHFNSRPSARGDAKIVLFASPRDTHFNSRPSARGDA